MKKIFIISGSFLIAILFFLGIYNFVFQKNNQTAQNKNTDQISTDSNNNSAGNASKVGVISAISDSGVFSVLADKKNKQLRYYSLKDGKAWQIDEDGKNLTEISSATLGGIIGAQWSPDGNMVITKFNREGKNTFYLYDYTTKKGVQLKDGIDVIAWDGLGKKIIYKYFDQATNNRSINIANPDGSNWQIIFDNLTLRNVSIAQIPLSSMISFWNSPSATEETKLNISGITGATQKVIFSGKFGADYLWSPDGLHALVSSLTDPGSNKMTIGVIDSFGANYKDLGVSTLASKCAWSDDSKTVYCAVPGNLPAGTIMPDDYMNKKIFSTDTFRRINIQTGKNDLLIQPQDISGEFDASNLLLSSTESNLYFVNRKDGLLYKVTL